ncbi:hypothetical protein IQ289_31555 [Burkholderia sp. R-70006]|nr:hypothetical protein [Burkholderia sp. R-70006]
MAEEKKPRGRPPTGNAKTPTERAKSFDEALLESGGRILNRLRLGQEANKALDDLKREYGYGSDRAAIETALVKHRKEVARRGK